MYSDDSIYVVFTKAKDLGWMRRLLHPEISHCYVMWPDNNRWIIYDHSINGITIFTVESVSAILAESRVIKIEANQTGWTFGLNTCVSSVKKLIGINNPFILTPYQLLKRLGKWEQS